MVRLLGVKIDPTSYFPERKVVAYFTTREKAESYVQKYIRPVGFSQESILHGFQSYQIEPHLENIPLIDPE